MRYMKVIYDMQTHTQQLSSSIETPDGIPSQPQLQTTAHITHFFLVPTIHLHRPTSTKPISHKVKS